MVKVRLDGLEPSRFVADPQAEVSSAAVLQPSQDAILTQKKYLELFGLRGNHKNQDLPKRVIPKLLVSSDLPDANTDVSWGRKRRPP